MRKPIAAALFALLAGGCMVGPDYVRPPVDAPAAWRLDEKDVRDLANTAWWEQLGDPVLRPNVVCAIFSVHPRRRTSQFREGLVTEDALIRWYPEPAEVDGSLGNKSVLPPAVR